jgi:aryl-phospho-beta-D-glucosidase BglC (GH1 family)
MELKVIGNKFVDEKCKEIILKGASMNSPGILKYEENHDFLKDIKEINNFGFNSVRVPICPAYFMSKEKYFEEILDKIVNLTEELGMYCLLTYHGQGNPKKGLVREPKMLINGYKKYDADSKNVKDSIKKIVKRYGDKKHVLFEPLSAYFLEVTKENWEGFSTELLEEIRNHTDGVVVISF